MQFRRVLVLVVVLVAAFAGLGYRLVDLQVVRHTELRAKAQKNTQREFLLTPRRGDILDTLSWSSVRIDRDRFAARLGHPYGSRVSSVLDDLRRRR